MMYKYVFDLIIIISGYFVPISEKSQTSRSYYRPSAVSIVAAVGAAGADFRGGILRTTESPFFSHE